MLGERSSGTNFITRLLGKNSDLRSSDELGWKHGFPSDQHIAPDLAVICAVRRADNWALSMHAKPWHSTPALQMMTFEDFIRAPWDTIIDHPKYFTKVMHHPIVGQPLVPDRDPQTGRRLPNLFALRRAKLEGMLSYMQRDCFFILMCMETAQKAPEATLDALLYTMRLPHRAGRLRAVHKRLGSKFNAAVQERPPTPEKLGAEDMQFLRSHVDLKREAQLGYHYD